MTGRLWVVVPGLLVLVRNLLAPVEALIGRIPDDALFYLVIARNLRSGHGFSFDGQDPTTGFHPAWLGVVALLPRGTPELGVRALAAAYGLVVLAAAALASEVLERSGTPPRLARAGAAALGVWGVSAYGIGMETALVALLALALVSARGSAAACLGAALGFTRLDMAPLALVAGRPGALGATVGVTATFLFNLVVAGDPISTSARLKGLGTIVGRLERLDLSTVWRHAPAPAVLALVVVALCLRGRPGPLAVAAGLAVLQLMASYLMNNLVGPWYHVPATWLLVGLAIQVAARTRGGSWWVGALVLALLRDLPLPEPGLHATVLRFAREVGARAEPDARLIAEDFPGILAWFSERDVLPADGLAAAPGYRTALIDGEVLAWWEARGATGYIVTRRRSAWLAKRPLVDHIAPPFLPVPATDVPLDPTRQLLLSTDPGTTRVFALFDLPP